MRGLVPGAHPPPPPNIPILVIIGLFDWILQPFPFQVASLESLSAVKERGGGEGPQGKRMKMKAAAAEHHRLHGLNHRNVLS